MFSVNLVQPSLSRHHSPGSDSFLHLHGSTLSCICLVKKLPHRCGAAVQGTLFRSADRVSRKMFPEGWVASQSPNKTRKLHNIGRVSQQEAVQTIVYDFTHASIYAGDDR